MPETRAYHVRTHFSMDDGVYNFHKLTGMFGDSDIAGDMSVSLPDKRPKLVATLASRKLDIVDIGPFIGYDPATIAKGPTAAATTQGTPTGGHPRILPDAPLRVDAMKVVRRPCRLSSVKTIAAPHVPVSNVALTLDLDHNLLALSPVTMDIAGTGTSPPISGSTRAGLRSSPITTSACRPLRSAG